MKLFHDDNSRLRYLTREEYDRLLDAVRASPEACVRTVLPEALLDSRPLL